MAHGEAGSILIFAVSALPKSQLGRGTRKRSQPAPAAANIEDAQRGLVNPLGPGGNVANERFNPGPSGGFIGIGHW
jgi:hypothetical protein